MDRNKALTPVAVIAALVVVVMSVVAFAIPFARGAVFWTSYVFAWIAVLVFAGVSWYMLSRAQTQRAAAYRASLPTISLVYVVVAVLFSIICMAIGVLPVWVVVLVHVLLLAGCVGAVLAGAAGANLVKRDEAAVKASTSFSREMHLQLENFIAYATDGEARALLKGLSDKVRYSDPVSSPATEGIEQQMYGYLPQIATALQAHDNRELKELCSQLTILVDQRNALCRSDK